MAELRASALAVRLANLLAARGIAADFRVDVQVFDDGDGKPPRLGCWDEKKLGPVPTQAEVDATSAQPPAPQSAPLSDGKLAALLVAKGLITAQDVTAAQAAEAMPEQP